MFELIQHKVSNMFFEKKHIKRIKMKLDVLGDRPQHTLPPSLGQDRRSNLLGIDKQANKWPAATCGGI